MFVEEVVYTTKTLERGFPGTIRGTAFAHIVISYWWVFCQRNTYQNF